MSTKNIKQVAKTADKKAKKGANKMTASASKKSVSANKKSAGLEAELETKSALGLKAGSEAKAGTGLSAEQIAKLEQMLSSEQVAEMQASLTPEEIVELMDKFYPFSSDVIFEALISDDEIARGIIEIILEREVSEISYKNPKQFKRFGIDSKGVILDAFLEDKHALYNIEMQDYRASGFGKRCRFYQGVIDVSSLRQGQDYHELKKSFVIFLCTHDQLNQDEPIQTFKRICTSNVKGADSKFVELNSEDTIVVCNAQAYKKASGKLRDLLEYIATGKVAQGNEFIKHLHEEVKFANGVPEVRSKAMFSEFKMRDYARNYADSCVRERDAEYAKRDAVRLAQFQALLQEMEHSGEISQKSKERLLSFQSKEEALQ